MDTVLTDTAVVENEIVRDMRAACRRMGWPVTSSDRFVHQAVEWLANGEPPLQIDGNDTDGWTVRGKDYSAGGDTLIDALVGAIFCDKPDRRLCSRKHP